MEEDGTTLCNCDGIRVGDYILESKLGEGSFSVVWKAQHCLTGQQVALKQVYLSKLNRHLRSCLNCELTFLSSVNHPNIIRLFHVFQVFLYLFSLQFLQFSRLPHFLILINYLRVLDCIELILVGLARFISFFICLYGFSWKNFVKALQYLFGNTYN